MTSQEPALRYAFNVLAFGREDVAVSIDRVARAAYEGIELVGEPDWYPEPVRLRRLVADAGLAVSSICALYGAADRDLSHPDRSVRASAVAYVTRMVDFAADLGATVVVVGPARWSRLQPLASAADEWAWAVESLRTAGAHAAAQGITLGLEPWNRYETHFLNRTDQAAALAAHVGMPSVGVHADAFHMNIEELAPIPDALRRLGPGLVHVHLADANRGAPGDGHLDFRSILAALRDMRYGGWVALEPFVPPARGAGTPGPSRAALDHLVARSIRHLRAAEVALARPA